MVKKKEEEMVELTMVEEKLTMVEEKSKVFTITLKNPTQSAFEQAMYGLGVDGATSFDMWLAFSAKGHVIIHLEKG